MVANNHVPPRIAYDAISVAVTVMMNTKTRGRSAAPGRSAPRILEFWGCIPPIEVQSDPSCYSLQLQFKFLAEDSATATSIKYKVVTLKLTAESADWIRGVELLVAD
jgi:hypothetical protein